MKLSRLLEAVSSVNYENFLNELQNEPQIKAEHPVLAAKAVLKIFQKYSIKSRLPEEYEDVILRDPKSIYAYMRILQNRGLSLKWPEGEEKIKISNDPWLQSIYVVNIIGQRRPDIEKFIQKNPAAWDDYIIRIKLPKSEIFYSGARPGPQKMVKTIPPNFCAYKLINNTDVKIGQKIIPGYVTSLPIGKNKLNGGIGGGAALIKVILPDPNERSTTEFTATEYGKNGTYYAGNPAIIGYNDTIIPNEEIVILVPVLIVDIFYSVDNYVYKNKRGQKMFVV